MPSLTMNLMKRIERLPKPRRSADAMQPLFEAISNSIQSTREKFGKAVGAKGRIMVEITTGRKRAPVSIIVQDNGVGLDKKNYEAFLETDTDNKFEIGGKGVGRLLWLDCFEKIHVETRYQDAKSTRSRNFDFKLSSDEQIKNLREAKLSSPVGTGVIIKFSGLRNNGYKAKFPGRPLYVVQHLASHFLSIFIGDNCPQITVQCGETYNFPKDIDKIIVRRENIKEVKSKKYGIFSLSLMECDKVASSDLKGTHFIHFIAHDRTVRSQPIGGKLGFKYFGSEERSVFHACIFGDFLNKNVNQERTGFNFEDAVIEEIVNDVCMPKIENFLSVPLATHKKEQGEIVSKIVSTYPSVEFGSLEELQKVIPLGELSDDAIFGHLSRQRFRRDQKQSDVIRSILNKLKGDDVIGKEFYSAVKEASEAVEVAEQKSLAEYIIRRKAVLDFLEVLIRKVRNSADDSSYQRENVLHSFICPLKVSTVGKSRQISSATSHELWVVDERLTFTQYFSSDMPFTELAKQYDSNERADLLIFDRVHGLRQSDQPSKVLLVEFKRPGRTSYGGNENPQLQIERYIKRLLKGGEVDVNGRPVHLGPETVFYCYIVADRIGKMQEWTFSWNETPDGRGRIYQARDGFKGSIELIEWDALISDARQRNRVFFDRAGIAAENIFAPDGG